MANIAIYSFVKRRERSNINLIQEERSHHTIGGKGKVEHDLDLR